MLETPPENLQLISQLQTWLRSWYGIEATLSPMAGYIDLNFKVSLSTGIKYVLKVNIDLSDENYLAAETNVLVSLQGGNREEAIYPEVIPKLDGTFLTRVTLVTGQKAMVRLLTFLEGTFYAQSTSSPSLAFGFGKFLAHLHSDLVAIENVNIKARHIVWDLQNALDLKPHLSAIPNPQRKRLAAYFFLQFEMVAIPVLKNLPKQLTHNDANDWNVLTHENEVTGIIDFGDLVYAPPIQEIATALAYAMMHSDAPLEVARQLLKGYQQVHSLEQKGIEVLYYLIAARLCTTAICTAVERKNGNNSGYVSVSEEGAWRLLEYLHRTNPKKASLLWSNPNVPKKETAHLFKERKNLFSNAMSISYQEPLHMEKAALQYMYDENGEAFLDCVNNIMHVGHCHPKVVQAAQKQLALLNTNTRYIYQSLTDYAKQLLSYFPERLCKVFFVNSGSAAADLALRLARNHTGRDQMLVMEHGYHGNSTATIEVSHYKYAGKGGPGRKPWIYEAPLPMNQQETPKVRVKEWIEKPVAGFIAESIVGCGGQVVFPEGYLNEIYDQVKAQGGVCIADEVQTGFGRVGTNFWAYELYEVEPDIVVLGKPMGNGHPLAAVVTTSEIAESFETGMEFFSSFGGNPVSCEVGKAVLEVIEEEGLQENARLVGSHLKTGLENLKGLFPCISEIRGSGLFLGVELVNSKGRADEVLATALVNALRQKGILLSTDGPHHNVIKIKPPMVFSQRNGDLLLKHLEEFLRAYFPS